MSLPSFLQQHIASQQPPPLPPCDKLQSDVMVKVLHRTEAVCNFHKTSLVEYSFSRGNLHVTTRSAATVALYCIERHDANDHDATYTIRTTAPKYLQQLASEMLLHVTDTRGRI